MVDNDIIFYLKGKKMYELVGTIYAGMFESTVINNTILLRIKFMLL